jgi:peroxiredoxin
VIVLRERLERIKEGAKQRIPADAREIMARATEELRRSGIASRSLQVGGVAPKFSLADASGHVVRSADLLARGPLAVSFYRGKWWPYCNAELAALQEALPEIQAAGGSLVAISPQLPEYSRELISQHRLMFPVLQDAHNEVARKFRLVFCLPDDLRVVYKKMGVDLGKYNGDARWELSIPGAYVIGRDGVVQYASVDPDYTTRPEPEELVAAIKQAGRESRNTARHVPAKGA